MCMITIIYIYISMWMSAVNPPAKNSIRLRGFYISFLARFLPNLVTPLSKFIVIAFLFDSGLRVLIILGSLSLCSDLD